MIGAGDRTRTCKKDLEGLHVTNYITHAFNGGRCQGRTDKVVTLDGFQYHSRRRLSG